MSDVRSTPEYTYTELPTIEQLKRSGWQHLEGDWYVPNFTERDNFRQVLLVDRLRAAIQRINTDDHDNPWVDDTQAAIALARLERLDAHRLMEANIAATELLQKGTPLERPDGRLQTAHYIDFDRPERNDFLVINQFRVNPPWMTGTQGYIVPDLVLFVNGIPLVVIECKSPKLENPLTEAIADLLKYSNQRNSSQQEGAERLFHYTLLMVAASAHRAAAGTIGATYEHYMDWKDTNPRTKPAVAAELGVTELNSRQMLIAGMLRPENLLDILRHFTLFKTSGGRTIKLIPRYQQYRAVHETIQRLLTQQNRLQHGTDDQRGGIIWHNQGSGKSFTMVFIIRKLRSMPALRRFKIVVVTDRTDLEKQLSETAVLTGEPLQPARNVKQLEALLRQPGSGLVFGMIQKFRGSIDSGEEESLEAMERNLNSSPDILVMIDEAHRSHTSALHANLLEALPNCARIGFTGTPIVKTKKKRTTEIFGSFIDTYNIRQSQEDEVTVPILYEGLEAMGAVKESDSLNQLFEVIFKNKSPQEQAAIKTQYANKSNVHEAQGLITAKAGHMLRHYVERILPEGFKAQVVASSRLAAVRYQKAFVEAQQALIQTLESRAAVLQVLDLDDLTDLDPETRFLVQALPHLNTLRRLEFAAVISSDSDDDASWRTWTDERRQETYIERFKKPLVHTDPTKQDGLAVLIVKSMLLTGFDAPLEQVLYLDRGMREHELLQAIARVNRTAPNKKYGLVVDYYGVDLAAALAVYENADIESAWFDIREELPKLEDRHRRIINFFTERECAISEVDTCVNLLRDERLRVEFTDQLKHFLQSLDTVLPRPEALRFIPDAKQLGFIRKAVADLYRDEKLNLVSAGEKVRALIDQYVQSQGIDPKVPPIDILSLDFKAHVQSHTSPRTRAAEMEFAARHHIDTHFDEDPAYYKKLSDRLEEILQSFADNWEAQVQALLPYIEDIQAGRPTDKTGLDPKTQLPFLSVLVEALSAESDEDLSRLAHATIEIVDYIRQKIRRINFWRSRTAPEELRGWIVDYLDARDLVPFEQQEAIADQMIQLAHKNHESLVS